MQTDDDPVEETLAFIDDTCLRCDSWNIRLVKLATGKIDYDCMDCNYFWTNV